MGLVNKFTDTFFLACHIFSRIRHQASRVLPSRKLSQSLMGEGRAYRLQLASEMLYQAVNACTFPSACTVSKEEIMRKTVGLACALVLLAAGMAWAQGTPSRHPVPMNSTDCMSCHEKTSPAVVQEWQTSAHGMTGVTCATCHGDEVNFQSSPPVQSCRGCHPAEVATAPERRNCTSCHTTHSYRAHRTHYLR